MPQRRKTKKTTSTTKPAGLTKAQVASYQRKVEGWLEKIAELESTLRQKGLSLTGLAGARSSLVGASEKLPSLAR